MTTWYQVSQWGGPKITPVEVTKESARFVTVLEEPWFGSKGRVERRHQKHGEYFPTFKEAQADIIQALERKIQGNRDEYSRYMQALKQARELQEKN